MLRLPVKGYEKNAWMLITLLGLLGIVFAFVLISETPLDPTQLQKQLGQSVNSFQASNPSAWSTIQYYDRDSGAALMGFSILGVGISYTAFRKGEKWAWYVELFLPLYLIFVTAESYYAGGVYWPLYAIFFLISLAALLLPYHRFFPKK